MGERLLYAEDVAEICGYTPATVIVKASAARRRHERGEPAGPSDLPLPVDWQRRQVTTQGGHTRTARSPRWRKADIDSFLATRRPRSRGRPFGRPRRQEAPDGTA